MKLFTNRALAAVFAMSLICGSATIALADRGGNSHSQGNGHAKATVHVKASTKVHGNSSSRHGQSTTVHSNTTIRHTTNYNGRAVAHGNSATAHSCINPAGNMRGWCKSHMNGAFITGTVTSINGRTAIVTLSNGQQVTIDTGGRNLTIGQQITLRGNFGTSNVFVPVNGNYSNYSGPYSTASVRGLIISVSGNSMQIAQGLSLITIDDSNAAARGAINGTLIPGRTITAYGSWSGSTFVATSIQ